MEVAFQTAYKHLEEVLSFLEKLKGKKQKREREDLIAKLRVFLQQNKQNTFPKDSNFKRDICNLTNSAENNSEYIDVEVSSHLLYDDVLRSGLYQSDLIYIDTDDLDDNQSAIVELEGDENDLIYIDTADPNKIDNGSDIVGDDSIQLFQGMWDCTADDSNELSFKRGQIVHIISKKYDSAGWWIAKRKGEIGFVPKTYLMEAYYCY